MTTTLMTTGLDVIFGTLSIAMGIICNDGDWCRERSDLIREKSISPSTSRENHAQRKDALRHLHYLRRGRVMDDQTDTKRSLWEKWSGTTVSMMMTKETYGD